MSIDRTISSEWEFRSPSDEIWRQATVPGCVHTDLLANGQIPDPFFGTNEGDLQWIDKQDWEYRTTFKVAPNEFAHSNLQLRFDGLDTYAEVFLNDSHVLSANNMFRIWKVDAKPFLRAGNNTLRIYFRSPIQEDLPKLETLGYSLPTPNDQSERGELGDKRLSVFSRKAPYHYGWDWGPRFVTSGIWRPVHLSAWSHGKIEDVFIEQTSVSAERADVTARITILSDSAWIGELIVDTDGVHASVAVNLREGANIVEVPMSIDRPRLWWSRGLGEAHLYTFTAKLSRDGDVIDEISTRTGLRAIKLIRNDDDAGTSFYFELNGVPVFAKGANHIPNDAFLTNMTKERYRHEIITAVESNMNMLRVWGGGTYESDVFYDLCDEYGILIWQDFMFACSMYPGDAAFLENVREEAKDNLVRLRNHPSIALWCGNNEMDTAWSQYEENGGWGWKQLYTSEQREKIWHDYESIFHHILPEVVERCIPGADYWPSSPMQALTRDASQHAKNDAPRGDIHYWGVWHAVEPFANYNVYLGRFMSEYGFQSFPELRTVETYARAEDMAIESEVMKWHQRSGDGNRLIKEYMDIYYNEPKNFESFLTMSQILQAEAIKMAMEAHRRKKPYCMGTLYWQINDCWPVASWSSMDYYGRWKALQYYAKRSYQDISVSVHEHEGLVEVYVISDILQEVSGRLICRLFDFSGNILEERTDFVSIPANTGIVANAIPTDAWLKGQTAESTVLVAILEVQEEIVDVKEHYFVPPNQVQLKQPSIVVSYKKTNGVPTKIVLETDVLAKHVVLTTDVEGIFSDNYFDLVPGVPRVIEFKVRTSDASGFTAAEPGNVQVTSMVDYIHLS